MKKKPEHYVSNKDFTAAVVEHVEKVNFAKENDLEPPNIPEYIGECILKIAQGLSRKPNFFAYSFRDEMIMDGVENCVKAIHNYNINANTRSGKPNAFAYFTQIIYFAFLRRISKEKKQMEIKEKYIMESNIEAFLTDDAHTKSNQSMIEKMRVRHENY